MTIICSPVDLATINAFTQGNHDTETAFYIKSVLFCFNCYVYSTSIAFMYEVNLYKDIIVNLIVKQVQINLFKQIEHVLLMYHLQSYIYKTTRIDISNIMIDSKCYICRK